jgi:hypothetical protein
MQTSAQRIADLRNLMALKAKVAALKPTKVHGTVPGRKSAFAVPELVNFEKSVRKK